MKVSITPAFWFALALAVFLVYSAFDISPLLAGELWQGTISPLHITQFLACGIAGAFALWYAVHSTGILAPVYQRLAPKAKTRPRS